MEELLKSWDGESLITTFDRAAEAWIIIAIHSTILGPATGGTRMKVYGNLSEAVIDAQRLSAGMTYKWAAAGLDMGGGKAVIAVGPDMNAGERRPLLLRYGTLLNRLKGLFLTGPDSGTSVADMDLIGSKAPDYVFGRSVEAGGAGDPGPFTARGVLEALEVTAGQLFDDRSLKGKRIVVQGVGSVGLALARLLLEAGADVCFSDTDSQAVRQCREELGFEMISPDAIYDLDCDFFVPCALGGILNEKTIPRLRCQAVVGAANNQLGVPEDAQRLLKRGILYAPDFVVNCGGAVAITGMETRGWSEAEATSRVREAVNTNLITIYTMSDAQGITTDQAALRLAKNRLRNTQV